MSNIGFATLQVIPSLRGLDASMAKGLAPAQGIANAEGAKAGQAFGGKFGAQFKKMLPSSIAGLNIGPLLGGALIAGAVVGLAEIGGAVGKMRRVIEEESGATGTTLNKLFDTAKREGAKVPASFGDIAAAVSELHRRGVPLGPMFDKLAEQELFLAKITKTDLAANVESTTGLFAKFNVPLKDQSRELDVLFKATQKSGKGLNDLLEPLAKGGANLQQFGFNLDQSIALIAGLSRAGINAQPVLASLRKAFGQIAKEGKDPQTVLRGIVKELTDGKNPTKAMADAIKLFGNRGGAELARAIQQGKFSVDGLLKSITDGKGGIIATGEATLTLADRFLLLKNQAALALAPLGSQIRKVFSEIVSQATPAISDLFGGIANAASALLPVFAPIAIAAEGMFKAALPVIRLFADDLNTIGDALHAIPGPVLAGAGALAILGLAALGAADGLIAAGRAAATSTLEFAFTPVGAAVIAFSALVTAVTIFSRQGGAAKAEAKDLGQALFDASSDATLFADGITSASSGLEQFLKNQFAAGKDQLLAGTLQVSGENAASLAKHLDDSDVSWKHYSKSVVDAAASNEHWSGSVKAMFGGKLLASLNKERDAWKQQARSVLGAVVANGQLKQSDVDLITQQHKNADGTLRYGEIVDAVNKKLGILSTQTDAAAQSAASSSPVYSELVSQFALGSISADSFASVLQDKFKFTAEGAKAAVKDLGEQIKQLGSQIESAFPSIGDAAKDLKTNVIGIANDLSARQALFARQLKQSSAEGAGATKQLRDSMSANLKAIGVDLKTLADDKDPERFTANLVKQAGNIAGFFANLHKLIREGFPQLAHDLLSLGVQGGANLAAGFASDKNKAEAGEAAIALLNQAKNDARAQGLRDFAAYQGIGKLLPEGVKQGIDSGKSKVGTAAAGIHRAARTSFGSLFDSGFFGGSQLPTGAASGITAGRGKVAAAAGALRGTAHTGLGSLFATGREAGASVPTGVASGIDASAPAAYHAATRLVDGVKHILGTALVIGSPSKWARDFIGKNLVLGLAQGLDPGPLDAPVKHLVAQMQKNLSRPLVIGSAFHPSAPTSGGHQGTLISPVVAPASFVPVQPIVLQVSGNSFIGAPTPEVKRFFLGILEEFSRNNPHKPLIHN